MTASQLWHLLLFGGYRRLRFCILDASTQTGQIGLADVPERLQFPTITYNGSMLTRRTTVVAMAAYGLAARAGMVPRVVRGDDDEEALNTALENGGLVQLEARPYRISGRGQFKGIQTSNTILRGRPGSTLESDFVYDGRPETDFSILGVARPNKILTNISLLDLTVKFTRPFTARANHPVVYIQQVKGLEIKRCTIQNGSFGIFLRQVEGFEISDNFIIDTYADGLQCANMGSHDLGMTIADGLITRNTCLRTGDDGIAVGAALGAGWSAGRNIRIYRNKIRDQARIGGGIGVYGVNGIVIDENEINNPAGHGIAVVSDTNNNQFNNTNVTVKRNVIKSSLNPSSPFRVSIFLANRNSAPGTSEDTGPILRSCRVKNNLIDVTDRTGIYLSLNSRYNSNTSRWPDDIVIARNEIKFSGQSNCPFPFEGVYIDKCHHLALIGNNVAGFPGKTFDISNAPGMTIT